MVNSKIIQTWTYLKANRRIYGTLHTLPNQPPSLDGGNWLTVEQDPLAMQDLANEQY